MRVVLCQAVHRSDEREVGLEPLGLAYISSYVSAHLPETEFFYAENVDEVLSRDPEIVGISTVSQNYDVASHLARELRERSYTGPLLLGGFHISALPTSLSSEFDAGVIGEGEQTMLEMVRLVGAHGFGSGHLLPLERRAGDDLGAGADQAAGPDSTTRQGYAFGTVAPCSGGGELRLFTSRGCPYDCGFCSSSQFWKTARFFGAEYVLREMSDLVERFHPGRLLIHDDLFIANRNRFRAIAESAGPG